MKSVSWEICGTQHPFAFRFAVAVLGHGGRGWHRHPWSHISLSF